MPEFNIGPDFWQFIEANIHANPHDLRLRYAGKTLPEVGDIALAINQIECRQRFKRKLRATLAENPRFIFPTILSGEQATSDAVAAFHATLVHEGCDVVDLTSGLGIDAMHIAPKAKTVVAVEQQPLLAEALRINSLKDTNLTVFNGDCVSLLAEGKLYGDVAFVDPARRATDGSRIFALADCQPSIPEMMPQLRQNFKQLMVKLSPMADITQVGRQLVGATDIYAIGTATECSEVFATVNLNDETLHNYAVHAVTLSADGKIISHFQASEAVGKNAPRIALPIPGEYVYEPYPALMKSGLADNYALDLDMAKIAPNTNIYFGTHKDIRGFDVWQLAKIIPWQSKNIKRIKHEYPRLDVAVRNFGISAEALRAKLGVSQARADDPRLIAVTDADQNRQLLILAKPQKS